MKVRAFEDDDTIAIPSETSAIPLRSSNIQDLGEEEEEEEDKENVFGSPLPDENVNHTKTPKQSTSKSMLGQAATPLLNLFSPSAAPKGEQQCQQQ